MKANEAPEKIYVHRTIHLGLLGASEMNITGSDIEYTRTDAFIEKATEFILKYAADSNPYGLSIQAENRIIDDFRKYMEGE